MKAQRVERELKTEAPRKRQMLGHRVFSTFQLPLRVEHPGGERF
jgi:hypothetical protein